MSSAALDALHLSADDRAHIIAYCTDKAILQLPTGEHITNERLAALVQYLKERQP